MGQKTEARIRQRGSLRATDTELSALVGQMARRYAKCTNYDGAPLARAMFQSVEERGQTLDAAAGSLGIDVGDGAYLLAGLRQDVAVDFAVTLLDGLKSDCMGRNRSEVTRNKTKYGLDEDGSSGVRAGSIRKLAIDT